LDFRKRSVAGFCASMNAEHTKYFSMTTHLGVNQEIVDGLQVCMKAALRNFFVINGTLPITIFVYRDGVGDSMLEAVVCFN
jgi:aubergine